MIFSENFLTNFSIAFESLLSNKLRSLLTALGVIFGVAAVIAMMAIGTGAEQEVLDQLEMVGVNNILIQPVFESDDGEEEFGEIDDDKKQSARKYSPGLTINDAKSIQKIVSTVKSISPEVIVETPLVRKGRSANGRLVGVEPFFFKIGNFELAEGAYFNRQQIEIGEQVCIIGYDVKKLFFSKEDPVGKFIKCGPLWMRVVGVMSERKVNEDAIADLGVRNFNTDVYTPLQTVLVRYKNRAKISPDDMGESDEDDVVQASNYHQLDRLTVTVTQTEDLSSTAEVITRLLARRHYQVEDYKIIVPELLLAQQQATKDLFKIVLICIASLSLLVGGIGIMNIMLASVLERIKEIGLRMSLGARKIDIVVQFVMESVLISVSGGLLGVFLGIVFAYAIEAFAGTVTIISIGSIIISFGVSMFIGLIFGILPAKRASELDPINALRYE